MVSKDEILGHFDRIFSTNTLKYIDLDMGLIKTIVENLYEKPTLPSPTYKRLLHKQNQVCDKLIETLSADQKELLEEYQQIRNKTHFLDDYQLFCFGYLFKAELDRESKLEKK